MNLVQQITTAPVQTMTLSLLDGSPVSLTITFIPMQYGWFITSLIYSPVSASYGAPSNYSGPFTLQGVRITNSPNMLNQFQNQIPFGLACFSSGNREPSLQEDFSSGNSKLYILTSEEVAQYREYLSGQ